jgi:23S rRNA pseudouridine1911/1915/1917 synthase
VRLGLAQSRRAARELIESGRVRVNGRRWRKGEAVASGDAVEIEPASETPAIAPAAKSELAILYEDRDLLIVAKPAPMACYPLRPGENGTMMNAVVARFPETAEAGPKPAEGGLIHRLDNGTSGALMIARNPGAYAAMRAALKNGAIMRRYHALVAGTIERPLRIDSPIAHHAKNPRRMVAVCGAPPVGSAASAYRSNPRPALTAVTPIRRIGGFTLVAAAPTTGVRHQIRVHLASAGFPIAGDELYGAPQALRLAPGRFWLHLAELELTAPNGAFVRVSAPYPADLESALSEAA